MKRPRPFSRAGSVLHPVVELGQQARGVRGDEAMRAQELGLAPHVQRDIDFRGYQDLSGTAQDVVVTIGGVCICVFEQTHLHTQALKHDAL